MILTRISVSLRSLPAQQPCKVIYGVRPLLHMRTVTFKRFHDSPETPGVGRGGADSPNNLPLLKLEFSTT